MVKELDVKFDTRTAELEKLVAKLQSDLKLSQKLQRENTKLVGDYNALHNSLSFKLGRMITFIPRKLRNAFKRKK